MSMSEKQQSPVYPAAPIVYPAAPDAYSAAPNVYPAAAPNVVHVIPSTVGQQYQAQLFALCAQGLHERKTEYGPCGIITAVACFPVGLICLFMDTHDKCSRCGVALSS